MDIFLHSLWHTVKEALLLLPLLYLTYLLVSYFSHNDNQKYSKILHRTNKAGPVIGAFLGCVPQCGFSSVMSSLYSKKMVSLGTLIAVFIATSDEAIPLMISKPEFIPSLLAMIAIKLVYAVIAGYLIDGIFALFAKKKVKLKEYHDKHCHDEHHHEITDCDHDDEDMKPYTDLHQTAHKCCHHDHAEHKHKGDCCATNIFLDALKHTAIIIACVFVITLAINLVEGYCGGLEPLKAIFGSNVYLQILMACVIGMIPNCVASVFLVELYMGGVIMFPALVAGLAAGAGVGLIVLFTANYKKVGQNIATAGLLFALAYVLGVISSFVPIL